MASRGSALFFALSLLATTNAWANSRHVNCTQLRGSDAARNVGLQLQLHEAPGPQCVELWSDLQLVSTLHIIRHSAATIRGSGGHRRKKISARNLETAAIFVWAGAELTLVRLTLVEASHGFIVARGGEFGPPKVTAFQCHFYENTWLPRGRKQQTVPTDMARIIADSTAMAAMGATVSFVSPTGRSVGLASSSRAAAALGVALTMLQPATVDATDYTGSTWINNQTQHLCEYSYDLFLAPAGLGTGANTQMCQGESNCMQNGGIPTLVFGQSNNKLIDHDTCRGAAINQVSGDLSVIECTFRMNEATDGGAIFYSGGRNPAPAAPDPYDGFAVTGKFVVERSAFSANVAQDNDASGAQEESSGHGGAIFVGQMLGQSVATGATFAKFVDTTFDSNVARSYDDGVAQGGAIFARDAALDAIGCVFTLNAAYNKGEAQAAKGGAVSIHGNNHPTRWEIAGFPGAALDQPICRFTSCVFSENDAEKGAAILNAGSELVAAQSRFSDNGLGHAIQRYPTTAPPGMDERVIFSYNRITIVGCDGLKRTNIEFEDSGYRRSCEPDDFGVEQQPCSFPNHEHTHSVFASMDTGGDGTVDLTEYKGWWRAPQNGGSTALDSVLETQFDELHNNDAALVRANLWHQRSVYSGPCIEEPLKEGVQCLQNTTNVDEDGNVVTPPPGIKQVVVDCPPGFFGDLCVQCHREQHCHSRGTCIAPERASDPAVTADWRSEAHCQCDPGYSTPACTTTSDCLATAACSVDNVCRRTAKCEPTAAMFIDDACTKMTNQACELETDPTGEQKCDFTPSGNDWCFQDDNECDSNPCQNGGVCLDSSDTTKVAPATYVCECVPGWSGSRCQDDQDECASGPCLNGATCVDSRTLTGMKMSACIMDDPVGKNKTKCEEEYAQAHPAPAVEAPLMSALESTVTLNFEHSYLAYATGVLGDAPGEPSDERATVDAELKMEIIKALSKVSNGTYIWNSSIGTDELAILSIKVAKNETTDETQDGSIVVSFSVITNTTFAMVLEAAINALGRGHASLPLASQNGEISIHATAGGGTVLTGKTTTFTVESIRDVVTEDQSAREWCDYLDAQHKCQEQPELVLDGDGHHIDPECCPGEHYNILQKKCIPCQVTRLTATVSVDAFACDCAPGWADPCDKMFESPTDSKCKAYYFGGGQPSDDGSTSAEKWTLCEASDFSEHTGNGGDKTDIEVCNEKASTCEVQTNTCQEYYDPEWYDVVPRCKYDAECTVLVDDYACQCIDGYSGKDCQKCEPEFNIMCDQRWIVVLVVVGTLVCLSLLAIHLLKSKSE
jgi:Notch-like protein